MLPSPARWTDPQVEVVVLSISVGMVGFMTAASQPVRSVAETQEASEEH